MSLNLQGHTVPPSHHKNSAVYNGTLQGYVKHLQAKEGLPFQLEIRLCSQLNSCFQDRKQEIWITQSLNF